MPTTGLIRSSGTSGARLVAKTRFDTRCFDGERFAHLGEERLAEPRPA